MSNQLKSHPEGSILMLTLFILLMLSLLGVTLMSNTMTELQVSGNTIRGRDAFAKADSLSRLGILMGRNVLIAGAGNPGDVLKARSGGSPGDEFYNVSIDPSLTFTNLKTLGLNSATEKGIKDRYLMATAATTPHMTMTLGTEVVATAALAIQEIDITPPGRSIGQSEYGSDDGNFLEVHLIVSSNGRTVTHKAGQGNYFTGEVDAAQSVIRTVFLELVR